jgi:hypothetical protein
LNASSRQDKRNPQHLREFFLDIDNRLGLSELGRQPLGFSFEPLIFGD